MMQIDRYPRTRMSCAFSILAALFVCIFTALFFKTREDHSWDGAVHTGGSITSIGAYPWQPSKKQGTAPIHIEFDYYVEGHPLHAKQFVTHGSFFLGQPVDVVYLPDRPWIAEIPIDVPPDVLPLLAISLFAVPTVLGMVSGELEHMLHIREKQKRKGKPLA